MTETSNATQTNTPETIRAPIDFLTRSGAIHRPYVPTEQVLVEVDCATDGLAIECGASCVLLPVGISRFRVNADRLPALRKLERTAADVAELERATKLHDQRYAAHREKALGEIDPRTSALALANLEEEVRMGWNPTPVSIFFELTGREPPPLLRVTLIEEHLAPEVPEHIQAKRDSEVANASAIALAVRDALAGASEAQAAAIATAVADALDRRDAKAKGKP